MQQIKLFIQGFIIGLGKIMPGVSGSVMAITFGLYETIISSLSNIKVMKKNLKFLGVLFLGIVLAVLVGSNIIKIFLTNHYLKTLMFFIGMMIPGIFPLVKNIKNKDLTFKRMMICVLVLFGLFILNVINIENGKEFNEPYFHTFLSLLLCGLLDAASTVIPGISGSALLMIVGYYERIITSLANILIFTDLFNSLLVLIPFLLGIGIGIVLVSKLITYLFKNYRVLTYMLIIVFAGFSVITLLGNALSIGASFKEYIFSICFLILGSFITILLDKTLKID